MVGLKLSLMILFHPIDSFYVVKRDKKQFAWWYAAILYLFSVLSQFAYIYFVHYPLSSIRPKDANLVLEIVKVLLPILTWVVASYAVTTILDGESHFGEIFKSTSLCTVPFTLITLTATALSRILSIEEEGLFILLQSLAIAWMVILIWISLKTGNDYSFGKSLIVTFISLIAMVIIWALCLLLFALTSQLFSLFSGLYLEIKMTLGK